MQATLSLDDDLVEVLAETARRSGASVDETVNRVLRQGLRPVRVEARPYRLKPVSMGGPLPGIDLDRALSLADALGDEAVLEKLGPGR